MRAAVRQQQLPDGCEFCADQLFARNFSGFLGKGFDHIARYIPLAEAENRAGANYSHTPLRMDFELSNTCNLECAMCSGYFSSTIRLNREKLPAFPQIYDEAFVDQLTPLLANLKTANFIGGEPFLIDIYYSIWERLIAIGSECVVAITTNGTVYTSRVRKILEKLNCRITVSLDSIETETYEAIRKNAKLSNTLRNLEAFCEINHNKGKSLAIATCPMVSNWRELPALVSFANERGISIFFNTVVFPAEHSIKELPKEKQRQIASYLRISNRKPTDDISRMNYEAVEGFCRQIDFWVGDDNTAELTPMQIRCQELMADCNIPNATLDLLTDIVGKRDSNSTRSRVEPGNALCHLIEYHKAIWDIGRILAEDDLISDATFDDASLNEFIAYLRCTIGPKQAARIYSEIRRFPREMMRFCGTLTTRQLIDLIEAHNASAQP